MSSSQSDSKHSLSTKSSLTWDRYGKINVRLVHVKREPSRHYVKELTVDVLLEGDLAASYLTGDNSKTVPTDTIKNTVYVMAKKHAVDPIETFGCHVASHFIDTFSHLEKALVRIVEHSWIRMIDPSTGHEHKHAFVKSEPERRVATVTLKRGARHVVQSSISGLTVLKTTGSGFTGFPKTEYTVLKEVEDRLFCTTVSAEWVYNTTTVDYASVYQKVRNAILDIFANRYSRSVQQTIYDIGVRVIDECPSVDSISLHMPNIHIFHFDIERFGLKNEDEIYSPQSDPSGFLEGTITRTRSKL